MLDAGGARSAYQVGALEVLLPALAERGHAAPSADRHQRRVHCSRPRSARRPTWSRRSRSRGSRSMLGKTTKPNVMRPLWRQVPEVLARYTSETFGLSGFRLRGLFGSQPLAKPSRSPSSGTPCTATSRRVSSSPRAVVAASVRTGRVIVFTESGSPVPRSTPEFHGRFVATRLDVAHLMASAAIPVLFPSVHVDEPAEAAGWYVDGATRRRIAARSGSRARCRSRGRGRHWRTAPARRGLRPGPGPRRPGGRRRHLARCGHGRPAATRPAAARGAQRETERPRARPGSQAPPRGARPGGVPHDPLRRRRARGRRRSLRALRWRSSAPTTARYWAPSAIPTCRSCTGCSAATARCRASFSPTSCSTPTSSLPLPSSAAATPSVGSSRHPDLWRTGDPGAGN